LHILINAHILREAFMAESEELDLVPNDENEEAEPVRRWRWDWILPLFFRPRKTLTAAADQEKGVWLLPLLLISLLVIFSVLASGPARLAELQMSSGETPPDFQWWTPEQQQQYFDTIQQSQGAVNLFVFPIIGKLIGVWLAWFLTGSILHLILTLSGSRSSNTSALNVVGWVSLPFALRGLLQGIVVLISKTPISAAGLSGFVGSESAGAAFFGPLLALVDIFLIWHFILLLVAARPLSKLPRARAWLAVLFTLLILLALQAVPGFIANKMSGLSGTGSYFFF
jgi:hypothetical protein